MAYGVKSRRSKTDGVTDDELCVLIEQHESYASTQSTDDVDRREAIQYYLGEPFGDEVEGRSQIVSREVADTIEWIKPSLMRIFASGDEIVRFDPHGPEDLEQAEQESDVLNWYCLQRNNAFNALYSWFTDALLTRNGYMVAYWDDAVDTSTEEYEGLSAEEMQMLEHDDEIEISEGPEVENRMEWTVRPDEMGQPIQQQIEVPYYSVTVKRTKKRGSLCYKCIPSERAIIDGLLQDVSLNESDFAGYWERMTLSALRQKFPDQDIPDDIQDDESAMQDSTMNARDRLINWRERSDIGGVDPSLRMVRVVFCWVRADVDGDGLAERRYVVKVGRKILYNDATDIVQMACLTPIIFPHRHKGVSMFDLLKDLQQIKTMVTRGMIDSIYLANSGRTAVNADRVNLDDMLVSRPGGIIRTQGDPGGSVMPIVQPFIGGQIVNTLEYLDAVGEKRTGVTKYNQGLDANTLNKTATGISLITQAAGQRIELIARVFAETGVKDLFLIGHALIRKHGDRQTVVKLRNKWMPIDPRSWAKRYDVSVSVGLGTGDKQQQAQSLQLIMQIQQQMIAGGVGIVSKDNLYNLAAKVVQTGGWKDVGSFFTDPSGQPQGQPQQGDPKQPFMPPQPPPDPRLQIEMQKMEVERGKQANEVEIAKGEGEQKFMLEKYKIDRQIELEQHKANAANAVNEQSAQLAGQAKQAAEMIRQYADRAAQEAAQGAAASASESVRIPVLETAQEALVPIMEQVGGLVKEMQQRRKPKSFRITRNKDGSKVISEEGAQDRKPAQFHLVRMPDGSKVIREQ